MKLSLMWRSEENKFEALLGDELEGNELHLVPLHHYPFFIHHTLRGSYSDRTITISDFFSIVLNNDKSYVTLQNILKYINLVIFLNKIQL